MSPRFLTMLRHPASVLDSKQRWYGGLAGRRLPRARLAQSDALHRARHARRSRVFVRYDDVLEDWTQAVGRIGETLDLDRARRHGRDAAHGT